MISLLLALMSGLAMAQDQVDLDKVDLSDLLNVKIESASKQSEPWAEAPVPVSIITKDMIKLAGVRTVHEALILFVPGYTDSEDRNELNFAPRGIYASSQQKVLIMLNGHRINSRSYLTAMPDYGIALHNLERIEVLRGPGSSLYGNVALGGVVNLITRKGKDLNKTSVEVGAGNHEQRRARFLTGSGNDSYDMLAWGQYYRTPGETVTINGNEEHAAGKTGNIYIDGVDNQASHDVGFNYKKDKWTYFGASRRGQWIEPYAGTVPYQYGAYRTSQEAGPGLGLEHQHIGAKYDTDLNSGWSLSFNPYYDSTNIEGILAGANGAGNMITWQDQDIGFITQLNKNYANGTFLGGVQVDAFEVTDSERITIVGGEHTTPDTRATQLLKPGGEEIYSAFVQNKHKFSDAWILNAGGRYDYKNRKSGDNYHKFSPRIAMIHLPNETWEYKLSYSESFVDAPYWYRYNNFAPFGGSEFLNPETLSATQFQGVWKSADKRIRNAATLFYQRGTDLIINNATAAGTPADPKYVNSGTIESTGLENEFAWLETKYQIFWNFSYSRALSAPNYGKFDDQFAHIPTITSNVVFNYLLSKDLSANLTVKYIGAQNYNSGTLTAPVTKEVEAATIFNLGARWENAANTGMFIDGRVYNVLDTEHFQGGQSQTQMPYRQAGRWWIVSAGYEF